MEDLNNLMGNKNNISNENITIKKKRETKIKKSTWKKIITFIILIFAIMVVSCIFIFIIFKRRNNIDSLLTKNNFPSNESQLEGQNEILNPNFKNIQNEIKNNDNYEDEIRVKLENLQNEINNSHDEDQPSRCEELDPINLFNKRLQVQPTTICQNGKSNHICYKDSNELFASPNGVICKMENIIIDPSKWEEGGYIYKGPVDNKKRGCPILSEGFFNIKCETYKNYSGYDFIYDNYFNGWNYKYNNINEELEELAPGKTVFFLSRNQDSPNLFHGGSEFVNVVSLLYLFDKNPEDIQIVFLDSIVINDDPFYDLYKNLISRGGEPVYVKDLNKKYHISNAILVPINYDSPLFKSSRETECSFPTKTFQFFNFLIDKYLNINFKDNFISDGEIYFYPKTTLDNHSSDTIFTKSVTIQWRKLWPKNRKSQGRLNGNGPELAEKLASLLPKNILVRLVNTAELPIAEQISIARRSNYFIGIHGAGLFLTIFSPKDCIVHEILPRPYNSLLRIMSGLSGHKTYSTIIKSNVKDIDGKSFIDFDPERFAENIIDKMKRNNFFD
jgi:hypothetical protein